LADQIDVGKLHDMSLSNDQPSKEKTPIKHYNLRQERGSKHGNNGGANLYVSMKDG